MHKIAVLISGSGTNLQALIDATISKELECEIKLVLSNKPNVQGLVRAQQNSIKTETLTLLSYKKQNKTRIEYDKDLATLICSHFDQKPDLIILAGFMHILSKEFIEHFNQGSIINLHPALPGMFDGAKAIPRALEAFQKGEIKNTGVMIHRCIPEVDRGEVIIQEIVPILDSDTLDDLEARIHVVEHKLIVQGAALALMLLDSK
jgi:phosphoribosylglycinamide formyltransferase